MALRTNKLTDWERDFKFFQEYLKKNYNRNLGIVISVIIPVYNEEDTIRAVLERIPNSKGMEVIVVDDHSTDNSVKEIEKVKSNCNFSLDRENLQLFYEKLALFLDIGVEEMLFKSVKDGVEMTSMKGIFCKEELGISYKKEFSGGIQKNVLSPLVKLLKENLFNKAYMDDVVFLFEGDNCQVLISLIS